MPAIVTDELRTVSANQFINAFQTTIYQNWITAESVSVGEIRLSASYKYVAVTSGTTGVVSPSHTVGTVSDGGVDWLYVEGFDITGNFKNNIYITIGRVLPWDNPTSGDENPITPLSDFSSQLDSLARVISAKRLSASSVRLAIQRYDWDITGTSVYSAFDPAVEDFNYVNPMFVFVDNNIYKCLNNNGGVASSTKPTGTSQNPFVTAGDSYLWQYMATVDPGDVVQFLTDSYVPVALKLTNDGSPQWNVQANAKSQSISSIILTNGGTLYTTPPTVTVSAPTGVGGINAVASAIVVGGIIQSIQMSNVGTGYLTTPVITISGGGGSGGTATAVLAPKDGNGSNILSELGARYAVVYAQFNDGEGGYFPTVGENDFRQIGLIMDPVDINNAPTTQLRYIGPDHDNWDGSETFGLSELKYGSGHILYIENIAPVVRSPGQIEEITITLRF